MTRPFHLADLVREHGRLRPTAEALVAGDRTVTYGELDERSNQVAHLLAAHVNPDARIAYLGPNAIEVPELLFGCAKASCVFVPLNWRLVESELAAVLDNARARVLLAGPGFAEMAQRLASEVKHALVVFDVGPDYEIALRAQPATDPERPQDSEDAVLQLYTSGTTGVAKGVLTTHANLDGIARRTTAAWQLDGASINLAAMPFFHIGGLGWLIVGLYAGARNVIVDAIEPSALLDTIERERVTNALLVPTVLQMLVSVPGGADHDFRSLRSIAYGASPITTNTVKAAAALFGCSMFQLYGLTETTGAIVQLDASDHDVGGPREHLLRSAGRPYPWVQLRIADPSTGAELPRGEVGEVWVKALNNTPGYFERPQETAALLTDDGWLRTGDGGYQDQDGYLFLTDRIKDMIVSGAENVYPIEVEEVISRHPGVAEVAVIGIPDDRWGEVVAAIVVPSSGRVPELDELVEFARHQLAGYKLPRSLELVDGLPKTASGKILKRELRARFGG